MGTKGGCVLGEACSTGSGSAAIATRLTEAAATAPTAVAAAPLKKLRRFMVFLSDEVASVARRATGRRGIIGRSASDRFKLETADSVKLGLIQPVEQILEIRLALARKADHEA